MKITSESNIGQLVAHDYRTASIFKKFGIDFCCNGNRSIGEACQNSSLDCDRVISSLEETMLQSSGTATDYASWPLDLLADYIEKKHHRYVQEKTLEIGPFLHKIVKVHGAQHPELVEVEKLFAESAGELAMHMKKEELVLFPFIRKMVQAKQNNQSLQAPHFGTVENPIGMMMHDHDAEGSRFRMIAQLTQGYQPPQDACNTYRVTFALLKEFEEDLHLHIHLENNILFPKSIALEKELTHVTA